jgi:hypothetical protein
MQDHRAVHSARMMANEPVRGGTTSTNLWRAWKSSVRDVTVQLAADVGAPRPGAGLYPAHVDDSVGLVDLPQLRILIGNDLLD